jgi:hypothetical protein
VLLLQPLRKRRAPIDGGMVCEMSVEWRFFFVIVHARLTL